MRTRSTRSSSDVFEQLPLRWKYRQSRSHHICESDSEEEEGEDRGTCSDPEDTRTLTTDSTDEERVRGLAQQLRGDPPSGRRPTHSGSDDQSDLSVNPDDQSDQAGDHSDHAVYHREVNHDTRHASCPASGRCPKCHKTYARLNQHIMNKHQGDFTVEEATKMRFQICACGRLCRNIAIHWGSSCPLPEHQQRALTTETREPTQLHPNTPSTNQQSTIQHLFATLSQDSATESDIILAYETLATLPSYSRLWLPQERRLINRAVTKFAEAYKARARPVDLLRILCIPKVACAPSMTKNKIGNLQRRLAEYPYLSDVQLFEERNERRQPPNTSQTLRQRIHQRLSRGKVGAAARLLENTLGIAEVNEETIEKLEDLHPHEDEHQWPLPRRGRNGQPAAPLTIPESRIFSTIFSTSAETAAGPSGLDGRFIYILRHNDAFTDLMTILANNIANGTLSPRELFLGARIIPLKKNSAGGIRPIAVGEILYRIAARAVVQEVKFQLQPFQFGVKSKLGVEPIIHLGRYMGRRHALISVDIRNAFNSIRRDWIHEEVRRHAPALLPAYRWSYSSHSLLFVGDQKLLSKSGVRQGDPLSPLLFSLGYSKLLAVLARRMEDNGVQTPMPLAAYLDDTYAMVAEDQVDRTLRVINETFSQYEVESGLRLNQQKTWVCEPEKFRSTGVALLGSHIGAGTTTFLAEKLKVWEEKLTKLDSLKVQDGYILLKQAILPELMHLQRTLRVDTEAWKEADRLLTQAINKVISRFEFDDFNRQLASLPTRFGGLGLPFPTTTAPVCLAASEGQSFNFLSKLSPGTIFPSEADSPRSQKERMQEHWLATRLTILQELTQEQQRILIDNSSMVGGRWLRALPVTGPLTFSDADFAAGICHRLLLNPAFCRVCREGASSAGHGDSCPANISLLTYRHEAVKRCLGTCFRDMGADVTLEASAAEGNGRIDLLVSSTLLNGSLAIDVSVCAVTGAGADEAVGIIPRSDGVGDACLLVKWRQVLQQILQKRYRSKRRTHAARRYAGIFTPLLITSGGTFHRESLQLLEKLRREAAPEYTRLLYELSGVLMTYRAKCFQRMTLPARPVVTSPRRPRRVPVERILVRA